MTNSVALRTMYSMETFMFNYVRVLILSLFVVLHSVNSCSLDMENSWLLE